MDDRFEDRIDAERRWESVDTRGRYRPSVLRAESGNGSVRFSPEIETPGTYDVYLYWPRDEALSTRVPVTIRHGEGTAEHMLNMRTPTEEAQGGFA